MNKVAYQPLTILERAQPGDSRPISNSAKVLRAVATFIAVLTLFGAVAIFSIGFSALTPGPAAPKGSAGVPVFPTTKLSPATPLDRDNGTDLLLPEKNQVRQGTEASDHPAINPTPPPLLNSTPPSAPAALPELQAPVGDSPLLQRESPEPVSTSLERELPKAVRKRLEKERRQAERKRSRLEEMYQKHSISIEAYKKGEEKYQRQIEKYRSEMNAGRAPQNEPGF